MVRKIKLSKTSKWILISAAALIVIAVVFVFTARTFFLDKAVTKIEAKLKKDYGIIFTSKQYELEGWQRLKMNGILCQSKQGDTLLKVEKLHVSIKMIPALFGKIRLNDVYIGTGFLNVGSLRQIEKINANKTKPTSDDTSKFSKAKKYLTYFQDLSEMLPDDFDADALSMIYNDSLDSFKVFIDSMQYHSNHIKARMKITTSGNLEHDWKIDGDFDRFSLKTNVTLATPKADFYKINFIKKLAKAEVGFKTLHLQLEEINKDESNIEFLGSVKGDEIMVYNERLSEDTVIINQIGLKFKTDLNQNTLSLDSNSVVNMNGIKAKVGGSYTYSEHEQVTAKINMKAVEAQSLINAFPQGTFNTVKGMKIQGKFSYKFQFYFDLKNKDSILINSDLDGHDIKILEYGTAKLDKLKSPFVYTPYNSKRQILIGPENPSFAPINEISNPLKSAILTSEDPGFYSHKGFVESSIESSFVQNVQSGEFKRGGSTISMQLVKNIFLTHKKTIDRKLEEAFIVWLIENEKIVSKSRIFEVYLNIIEWGPNVYGIGEASNYYFNTTPANLTLNESIFLASIIPQPLAFQWRFDSLGNLKPYMQKHLDFISKIMVRRGLIPSEDTVSFNPNVYVVGPARSRLRIKVEAADTIEEKSSEFNWKDIFNLNIFKKKQKE